ncbi:hypothetical protein NHX12_002422 [Muraenolepis orangiensis]|uniref:Uncharacterized protein n=1 Tax=Muraenolepis orangiensis TaxID=630683 RepID=A0A9Q0DYT6_9TELE|nr:hypothetical protein NHX12_002422 [Muraenolepis orangiensis]
MPPAVGARPPLDFSELDSALRQQERIMSVSHLLASQASHQSKLVAEWPVDRLLSGTPSSGPGVWGLPGMCTEI